MRDSWLSLKSGSDIRGYAQAADGHEVELTKELCEMIGYAFALWLASEHGTTPDKLTIAVGQDSRVSSERLSKALMHGLTCADCDVYDCGLCATPAMFLTMSHPDVMADGAIMVTTSHPDGAMNGFKLFYDGDGLDAEEIEEVIKSAQKLTLPHRLVSGLDLKELYAQSLTEMVKKRLDTDVACPLVGMSVVVDESGSMGKFFSELLENLGCDTSGSFAFDPSSDEPGYVPDIEKPENMQGLIDAVNDHEADLGFMFDIDGVRLAIVDSSGKPITGNRLIALTVAMLIEQEPRATIVTDSVTSSGLARFITELGGTHYRFKRGYRNVIDEAVRLNEEGINCPGAMETSGHIALREHNFIDDGLYLAMKVVAQALKLKREGQTIESLIDWLQEPVESLEIRMKVNGKDVRESAAWIIQEVLSQTLKNPAWHLAADNREGARITFDLDGGVHNAWFMLRLSVHDPVMALNAQSDVKGGVKKILTELYELLKDDEEDLDLTLLKQSLANMP